MEWAALVLVYHFFKRLKSECQMMLKYLPPANQWLTCTWNVSGVPVPRWLRGWEAVLVGTGWRAGADCPLWGGRWQACAEWWKPSFWHCREKKPHDFTSHRARSEWQNPSASFNLKLLGWGWHLHKNNTYSTRSPSSTCGWLNTSSYLTEHWKLLLHHSVDLSITNCRLGK